MVAACAIVVAVLGIWLAHTAHSDAFDTLVDGWVLNTVQPWVHTHLGGHQIIANTRLIGNPKRVTIICAVLFGGCLLLRRVRGALLIAIAVPLAGAITEFALKPLFDRKMDGFLAYPSGHVTGVSAMAVAVLVLLVGPARPPLPAPVRWLLVAVVTLVVLAVMVAVIALHDHYFTDTVGGVAVGTATVLLTAMALDWLTARGGTRLGFLRGSRRNARLGDPDSEPDLGASGGISEAARRLPPA